MSTRYILLWLEAPLQSWGYDSKFNRRDTLDFPTKSGILGLVLCAMGASGKQAKLLARFADLKQTVLSFRHETDKAGMLEAKQPLLRDFQMIGAGYDGTDSWQDMLIPKKMDGKKPTNSAGTKLTHRYYLQNAFFAVILEVPEDISEEIGNALQNPVYPVYLGRRCCVPTEFVFQGIYDDEKDAEKAAFAQADKKSLREDFRVADGDSENGDAFTLNDVPVEFGKQKRYKDRRVTKIWSTGNAE